MYHPDDLPLRATLERRDSDLQLSPRTGTSRISSLLASPIRSIGKQPSGSRLRQPATRTLAVLLVCAGAAAAYVVRPHRLFMSSPCLKACGLRFLRGAFVHGTA